MSTIFHTPEAFYLLLILPLWGLRHLQSLRGDGATVKHPGVFAMPSRGYIWHHLLFLLKAAALVLLVVALARPQKVLGGEDLITEGVDIMVALDVSGSMDARDFQPRNRLEVAKQVVDDFIKGRQADRIGLVVFAGRAVTRCPLTVDYDVLLKLVDSTQLNMLPDGTAIGNALGTAVGRLRVSKAKSRVIILVTDGVNNRGEIDPLTAAEMAAALKVKVYTVGVGRQGPVPFPVVNPYTGEKQVRMMKVEMDEATLKEIARRTGGRYFQATDPQAMRRIFQRIDNLEKSKVKIRRWSTYTELYPPFLVAGLLVLAGWFLLSETVFRRIP